ncbi:MAG: DUF1566 domain-containing protein [Saprospiraceae bacterium]|nr:DUF1566 domain-containing protein [Saprospiraceae bacterium]
MTSLSSIQAQALEVLDKVKITDGTQGNGKVLTSDADGLASWSSPGLSIGDLQDGSRQHGLVANTVDQPDTYIWTVDTVKVGAFADGPHGGAFNQRMIFEKYPGNMAPAAWACSSININNTYYDWYLPSRYELYLMYQTIGPGAPAPNTNIGNFADARYWSSTEYQESGEKCCAHFIDFHTGTTNFFYDNNKDDTSYKVRAIRAF